MTSNKFVIAMLLAAGVLPAHAEEIPTNDKLDGALQSLLASQKQTRGTKTDSLSYGPRKFHVDEPLSTILTVTDAPTVVRLVQEAGYEATHIVDEYVVANIPLAWVQSLAAQSQVQHITLSNVHQLFMDKARSEGKVDDVQTGKGLDTPFTGKGVILGIIDQGFQFRHAAFLNDDNTSRVRSLWNRRNLNNASTPITDNIPDSGETNGTHATHVAGIAAGSNLNNRWQGVAPEAEIIMIPSTFAEGEVLKEIKYVKEFAEKEGKPWVVNMSFGSSIGPHDGKTSFDQAGKKLTGPGGLLTAAMGNERQSTLHAQGIIPPKEARYIFTQAETGKDKDWVVLDIWPRNGARGRLKVTPVLLYDGQVHPETNEFIKTVGYINSTVNNLSFNRGELYQINMKMLCEAKGREDIQFGVKLEKSYNDTIPVVVHAWANQGQGSIKTTAPAGYEAVTLLGDNEYQVANGAASIPTAIAVASYNSRNTFRSLEDKTDYQYYIGNTGDISNFSNYGPYLDDQYLKPSIAAPGAVINSAINSFEKDFKATANTVTGVVERGTSRYYYGAMMGTSMATPFVAGVLCLWLEADPTLDYDRVMEVFRKTARRDYFFNRSNPSPDNPDWSTSFGYGKIDAFAGLQYILSSPSALPRLNNSPAPVTIAKHQDRWDVLFNNAERFAHLRVLDMAGKTLRQQSLHGVPQGHATAIDLAQLPAGVYLIQIQTSGSNTTRKVMVE